MGTNECSQPASKSSWDSQDFGDVNMVLKMVHFHKSSRPQWVNWMFPCHPPRMARQILVNICPGNGLLPHGTKPLPEPM